MKRWVLSLIILCLFLLVSCSSPDASTTTKNSSPASTSDSAKEEVSKESTEQSSQPKANTPAVEALNVEGFLELLSTLPLSISETNYLVQDDEFKALYPDLLSALLHNNTTQDIKDAVIAFVAWDENYLPVKIQGQFDFTNGEYIKEVAYDDINLAAGSSFGENSGLQLSEKNNISHFLAVPVSFKTFDGETWANPYYKEFKKLFEGNKFNTDLTVEVTRVQETFALSSGNSPTPTSTVGSDKTVDALLLETSLSELPLTILETNYVVQDTEFKALYPDMLQVILKNNTEEDIKNAVVGFVAWDENNLPVKIQGQFDFSNGSYLAQVNYDEINLIPGGTFGDSAGFKLNENNTIDTVKAIVVSYETFDGKSWKNPLLKDFTSLYEGKKLAN